MEIGNTGSSVVCPFPVCFWSWLYLPYYNAPCIVVSIWGKGVVSSHGKAFGHFFRWLAVHSHYGFLKIELHPPFFSLPCYKILWKISLQCLNIIAYFCSMFIPKSSNDLFRCWRSQRRRLCSSFELFFLCRVISCAFPCKFLSEVFWRSMSFSTRLTFLFLSWICLLHRLFFFALTSKLHWFCFFGKYVFEFPKWNICSILRGWSLMSSGCHDSHHLFVPHGLSGDHKVSHIVCFQSDRAFLPLGN